MARFYNRGDKMTNKPALKRLGENLDAKQITGLLGAPLLAVFTYWMVWDQGPQIAGAMAITAFAAVLWISEALPLPVTALLVPVGLAGLGVFEARDAFTSFGSPVLFLVLGGYALAVAVEANGVDRWIAGKILGLAGAKTMGLLAAFMLTSALLSMLISNTATTALLIPVVAGVLAGQVRDDNLSRLLFLGVAYGASIGGVATITGSAPNAIAAGLLELSFLQWMAYGLPVSMVMIVVAMFILWWTFPPKEKNICVKFSEPALLTPMGKRVLGIGGFILLLWLAGPALAQITGLPAGFVSAAAVAAIAVALLVGAGSVTWKALEKNVHWGVLLLLGGGLSLGRGLTDSGAADWLAQMLTGHVDDWGMLGLKLMLVGVAVFATELISNTAVTAKLAPILMGVALHLGMQAESLVLPVAIATSMAFMLPVATPPNALVHASGYVQQRDMMRAGLRLNLAAIAVITLLFHFVL
jgi:sodium-dependent dicarboxylate transporter 2/3/5